MQTPPTRSTMGEADESESPRATEEQRRKRQRSIQLCMQLLQQASACRNPWCTSVDCCEMKNYLKHCATCQVRVQGGCTTCRRICVMLAIHAKQCQCDSCVVPNCRQVKAKVAELRSSARPSKRKRDDDTCAEVLHDIKISGQAAAPAAVANVEITGKQDVNARIRKALAAAERDGAVVDLTTP